MLLKFEYLVQCYLHRYLFCVRCIAYKGSERGVKQIDRREMHSYYVFSCLIAADSGLEKSVETGYLQVAPSSARRYNAWENVRVVKEMPLYGVATPVEWGGQEGGRGCGGGSNRSGMDGLFEDA
jgi:hypothetical protein